MGGGSTHHPASLRDISSQPPYTGNNPFGLPNIKVGVRKTDKKKLPMDNEFSTMEHLAKAQAGYIRTVN